jgi:hypothetical protein
MTAKQFNETLAKLKLSVYAAAPILGISLRQAQRYSSGEQDVAAPVASLLGLLVDQVRGFKERRKQLYNMLAVFERRHGRISENGRDVTFAHVAELHRMIVEMESLLRKHPAGLPPQIDLTDPPIFQYLTEASDTPQIFGVRSAKLRAAAVADEVEGALTQPLSEIYLHLKGRLERAANRDRRLGRVTPGTPYEVGNF